MSKTLTKASRPSRLHPALCATTLALTMLLANMSPATAAGMREVSPPATGKPSATTQNKKKKMSVINRGLESVNQPVVTRTDFTFDAIPDGYDGLSRDERKRLIDWFDAIGLSYGDRVAIADGGYERTGIANAIAGLVGRYGLLLAEEAPRTAGEAPSGAVRIVVSRSTASVPGCPRWGDKLEADYQGGLSAEYGCAVNSNLAAMIANPEDLVQGRQAHSSLRGASASKAIKAYNNAAPSGGGGNTLK